MEKCSINFTIGLRDMGPKIWLWNDIYLPAFSTQKFVTYRKFVLFIISYSVFLAINYIFFKTSFFTHILIENCTFKIQNKSSGPGCMNTYKSIINLLIKHIFGNLTHLVKIIIFKQAAYNIWMSPTNVLSLFFTLWNCNVLMFSGLILRKWFMHSDFF